MIKELTHIYTLSDPRTGLVLYVGKSNDPKQRYRRHIYENKVTRKGSWIKSLILNGLMPVMDVIDSIPVSDWEFYEKQYIKMYKACGANLLNMNEGGNRAMASLETRFKQREAKFGKKISDEVLERLRAKRESKRRNFPIKIKNKRIHSQISSYSLSGNLIKTYGSLSQASRDTNVAKHVIVKICRIRKNYIQAKGFVFRYGCDDKAVNIPDRNFSMQKSVIQMSLDGNFIAEYKTVREASRAVKVTDPAIHAVCLGKRKTSKGFKWKYKNDKQPQQ